MSQIHIPVQLLCRSLFPTILPGHARSYSFPRLAVHRSCHIFFVDNAALRWQGVFSKPRMEGTLLLPAVSALADDATVTAAVCTGRDPPSPQGPVGELLPSIEASLHILSPSDQRTRQTKVTLSPVIPNL